MLVKNSSLKRLLGGLGLLTCLLICSPTSAQQQPNDLDLCEKEASMQINKATTENLPLCNNHCNSQEILVEGGFLKILNELLPLESIESIEVWADVEKYLGQPLARSSELDINERVKNIQTKGMHSIFEDKKSINFFINEISFFKIKKLNQPTTDIDQFHILIKIKSKTTYLDLFFTESKNSKFIEAANVPFFIKTTNSKLYEKYVFEIDEYELFYNIPVLPYFN